MIFLRNIETILIRERDKTGVELVTITDIYGQAVSNKRCIICKQGMM